MKLIERIVNWFKALFVRKVDAHYTTPTATYGSYATDAALSEGQRTMWALGKAQAKRLRRRERNLRIVAAGGMNAVAGR